MFPGAAGLHSVPSEDTGSKIEKKRSKKKKENFALGAMQPRTGPDTAGTCMKSQMRIIA